MARTNDINSATSQFFINLSDNEFLDNSPGNYGYAVFGKCRRRPGHHRPHREGTHRPAQGP